MKAMHILVTGAGGKTGRHVIAALLARGTRVRAWVHSGQGAPDWPQDQVDVLAGDLMQASLFLKPYKHSEVASFDYSSIIVTRKVAELQSEDGSYGQPLVSTYFFMEGITNESFLEKPW